MRSNRARPNIALQLGDMSSTVRRRYFWWGLGGAFAVLSCFAIGIVVEIAFSYDGECGGLVPFLASPKPCPFWEYVSGRATFALAILWSTYWPFALALVVVAASFGYSIDKWEQKRVA